MGMDFLERKVAIDKPYAVLETVHE